MTAAVLVAETIVKSIMSSIYPIVYTIVPAIIPVSSRSSAVPATVAGIMAIYKLATLTVVVIIVVTSPPAALSEGGPREGQCEQQREHRKRYQVLSVPKKSHTILQIARLPLQPKLVLV
jgi:hypothetical protein